MKTIEEKFQAIKDWVAAQESFPERDAKNGEILVKKRSGCIDVWIGSRPADRIVLNIETPLEAYNHSEVHAIHAILGLSERDAVEAERKRVEPLIDCIGNTQFMYKCYLASKDDANRFNLSDSIGKLGRAKTAYQKGAPEA